MTEASLSQFAQVRGFLPVSPCQPALPTDPPQKDTLYTYDLAGRLIAENHTYGVYKRAFVYLNELPVAMLFSSDD